MALGSMVEYLRARRRIGNPQFPLVGQGGQQTHIPVFAASAITTIELRPPGDDYASIGYRVFADHGVVIPDVFSVDIHQWGQRVVSGVIDAAILRDGIDAFLVITDATPVVFTLTNRDTVNARIWSNSMLFLTVDSRPTLEEVYGVIQQFSSSSLVQDALGKLERTLDTVPVTARRGGGGAVPILSSRRVR